MKRLRCALYHRASTLDQDPALCRRELHDAAQVRGLEVLIDIEETGTGRRNDRPGLQRVMEAARRGQIDMVLVWRLNRFGRSMIDLLSNIKELQRLGVRFVATSQGIEVGPSRDAITGLVVGVLAALAEFESEQISEGTRVGMRKRRDEGGHLGRPLSADLPDGAEVLRLRQAGKTWGQIAQHFGLDPETERYKVQRAAKRLTHRPARAMVEQ